MTFRVTTKKERKIPRSARERGMDRAIYGGYFKPCGWRGCRAEGLFEFLLIEILGISRIRVVMTNEFEVIAIVIQFKLG